MMTALIATDFSPEIDVGTPITGHLTLILRQREERAPCCRGTSTLTPSLI